MKYEHGGHYVGKVKDKNPPLPRWVIVIAAAVVALLARQQVSEAQVPWCPIQGCVDTVNTTCGVCQTINGNYAVYKPKKT